MSSSPRKNKTSPSTVFILIALVAITVFDTWGVFWLAARLKPVFAQATTAAPIATSMPTATVTQAPSSTPSATKTATLTSTATATHTPTFTPTFTPTPTPGVGSTWIRPADGMVMVFVPAGEFNMGREAGDTPEKPVHTVTLDAFWIDQTEVTNGMYALCVQAGACQPPRYFSSRSRVSYYSNLQFVDYPVIHVDWNNAQAYCQWSGAGLPTEAQWEKAARGTDGRTFPWGNTFPTCALANFWNGRRGCTGDTQPVGSHPGGVSPYGALDMGGNVWEWVADWYEKGYYGKSPLSNPAGPFAGQSRVVRGGSFGDVAGYLTTSVRLIYAPSLSLNYVGFRCAR
jgi:formylglycine-generating enzyme required for sulfatase activity